MADNKTHRNPRSTKGNTFSVVLILVALAIGLFFLVKGLVPADLPASNGSNFIDSTFHNKGVILAARLLLVSAAVVLAVGGIFIISSTVMRMANGEWLRRAGPFEVPEAAVSDIESQIEKWRLAAEAGEEEIAELAERLKDSDELIEQLQMHLMMARAETLQGSPLPWVSSHGRAIIGSKVVRRAQ